MILITCGHRTDVGRVREVNQDNYAVIHRDGLGGLADCLCVVADGMGGMAGGEIASARTVQIVPAVVRQVLEEQGETSEPAAMVEALRQAMAVANKAVWQEARSNPELRGMGTTCVAALLRGNLAAIANVGDSRIYLLRHGELIQMTHDHSLVQEHVREGNLTREEARVSRYRNVITRAIGIASDVQPDVDLIELEKGDTLLLCTDGLTVMVDEQEIAEALSAIEDAQKAADWLVEAANRRGGIDNTTVVVARHGEFVPTGEPPLLGDEEEGDMRRSLLEAGLLRERGAAESRLISLLVCLIIVLAAALVYSMGTQYEIASSWPFLRPKPPPVVAPVRAPVVMRDFGTLTYAPPTLLLNKPLRGAPISCDAAGNIYVVSQSGRALLIAKDGSRTTPVAAPVPAPSPAEVHWAGDSQGYLYVSVKKDKCIYRYDRTGTRRGVIGQGELEGPEGIAVDGQGNILVIDKNRLKVIRPN